jgi:site-specific recombinase XerC
MDSYLTDFSAWLECQGRSKMTLEAYTSDVAVYARWFEQVAAMPFQPSLLTGRDLRAWREASLNREFVAGSTWNRRRASMRVYCAWALQAGHVAVDPFEGVQPADVREAPILWLDDNEFNKILRHLEHQVNAAKTDSWRIQAIRNRAMVALMVFAGLRESEVVSLRMSGLQLTERKGAVSVRNGKGGTFYDDIPLNYEAVTDIRAWLAVRGEGDGFLFAGEDAAHLTTRQIQRVVAGIGKACGIDALTPHRFRHTFCKRTLDGKYSKNGLPVPLTVVQRLARHARISTTARYAKPGQRDMEAALGAL